MDMFDSDLSIPIHLLRQWCFCPRIVYYQELLKVRTYKPLWVAQGEKFHQEIQHLEKRRNFSRYGLDNATRHFNINVKSIKYKLHGIIDWVLETDDAVYVVEYKTNPNPNSLGHKLQVIAYALLTEEYFGKPSKIAFLVSDKKSYEIPVTQDLIIKLIQTVSNILRILDSGIKPNSSASEHQCIQCEYINFCNDRL